MAEASLAAQRLAVTIMRAHAPLTALVPSANIFDRHSRPEVFPCVIVGEGTTTADLADCVEGSIVSLDMHIWTTENGFVACKSAAGEVRRALSQVSGEQDGFRLDFNFDDTLFLRDPDGEHSHGVANFTIYAEEIQ